MVYVGVIEDDHALIFDGPVTYGQSDPKFATVQKIRSSLAEWHIGSLGSES